MHNSTNHLSKDLVELIKAIGDSRSKQEEDKILYYLYNYINII